MAVLFFNFRTTAQSQAKLTTSASMAEGVYPGSSSFYYVESGGGIRKVENADPSKVKVKEWRVKLYKRGFPRTGNTNWGSISAPTAAAVMEKLKASQEFELRSNAFFGKGRVQDEVCTSFNPLGPIAILDGASGSAKDNDRGQAKEKLMEIVTQLKDFKDFKDKMMDMHDFVKNGPHGNFMESYIDEFTNAGLRAEATKTMLGDFTNSSMEKINARIAELDASMASLKSKKQKLANTFSQQRKAPANPGLTVTGTNEEKILKLTNMLLDLSQKASSAATNENEKELNAINVQMVSVLRALIQIYRQDPDMKEAMGLLEQQLALLEESTKN